MDGLDGHVPPQDRIPAQEWAQIFDEVWRRYRDFFYVENMHGYDWKALREQYRPWLKHVQHRTDLTYVLTEMIAELNCGHTYVEGGDYLLPERPVNRGWSGRAPRSDSAPRRARVVPSGAVCPGRGCAARASVSAGSRVAARRI